MTTTTLMLFQSYRPLAFLGMILAVSSGLSDTLLVSNTADSGPGSLRDAIQENHTLGGGHTILFSNVVSGTIKLTSGELLVETNVTIVGPGPSLLTISGNGASRVIRFTNVTATPSGV